MKYKTAVVIPNWNGKEVIGPCLDSLRDQSEKHHIIVVDNGSVDSSPEMIKQRYPEVELIELPKNRGFAGGVNVGIKRALELGAEFIALFNDDATADMGWLRHLVSTLEDKPEVGIATGKFLDQSGKTFDSTGDQYTTWGLPFPRGRGSKASDQYMSEEFVFSATGGASLYRAKTLKQIGLFDEDFFAYYEDVDISFRAQLAGWKILYTPKAIAYHQIGATSGKLKGFTTYQTMKNLPWLFWKNVPHGLMLKVFVRFKLAYFSFWLSALKRGDGWTATKGFLAMLSKFPKKLAQRHHIQSNRKVTKEYIASIMTWDLPANAHKLRAARQKWWKVRGKRV